MRPLHALALSSLLVPAACRSDLDGTVSPDDAHALADTYVDHVVGEPAACTTDGAPARAYDADGAELVVPVALDAADTSWTVPAEVAVLEVCAGTWTAHLTVEHDLSIRGPGDAEQAVLSGGHAGTPLTVRGARVVLEHLTIADGVAIDLDERDDGDGDQGGGVLAVDAELEVHDVVFTDHLARFGGSAALVDSRATFSETTFWYGAALVEGGALALDGESHAELVDSSLFANQAGSGGGIAVRGGGLQLDGVVMLENSATQRGGGLYATEGAEVEILDSSIGHQHAEIGGALSLERADARIRHSTLDDNEAQERGGAIDVETARLQLRESVLIYNASEHVGGGLAVTHGAVRGEGCVFYGNESEVQGGAVWQDGGDVDLTDCLFAGNSP